MGLGYYCLMGDANWRMCIGGFTGNDSDYADNACWDGVVGHYLDNRATSVFNNGYAGAPDDIQSFRHPNYVEMIWFVPQGNYCSNVDQWCGALPCNDQASSHRWGVEPRAHPPRTSESQEASFVAMTVLDDESGLVIVKV